MIWKIVSGVINCTHIINKLNALERSDLHSWCSTSWNPNTFLPLPSCLVHVTSSPLTRHGKKRWANSKNHKEREQEKYFTEAFVTISVTLRLKLLRKMSIRLCNKVICGKIFKWIMKLKLISLEYLSWLNMSPFHWRKLIVVKEPGLFYIFIAKKVVYRIKEREHCKLKN